MIKSSFIIFISIILFSCCDGVIETEVKLSDLQKNTKKQLSGDLYIEIAGCSDYEDSRKESDSLKEVRMTVPSIFKGAKYIECFQKEFQSYTHFKIPIILSHSDQLVSKDYIHIISNDNNILAVGVPPTIKRNMDRVKANSFGVTDIALNVHIKFINDTNKDMPIKVVSAYLDDKPYIYGELTSIKNNSFIIRLSNVSVDNALENQFSTVLLK